MYGWMDACFLIRVGRRERGKREDVVKDDEDTWLGGRIGWGRRDLKKDWMEWEEIR